MRPPWPPGGNRASKPVVPPLSRNSGTATLQDAAMRASSVPASLVLTTLRAVGARPCGWTPPPCRGRWAAALETLSAARRQGRCAAPSRHGAWGRRGGPCRWTRHETQFVGRRPPTGPCSRRQTARYAAPHAPTGAAKGRQPPMSRPGSGSPRKSRHGYTAWRSSRSRHVPQRTGASESQHDAQANTVRVQLHGIVSVVSLLHPTHSPSSCSMFSAPYRQEQAGEATAPAHSEQVDRGAAPLVTDASA